MLQAVHFRRMRCHEVAGEKNQVRIEGIDLGDGTGKRPAAAAERFQMQVRNLDYPVAVK